VNDAILTKDPVDTYPAPAHGWTCFHCGEHFPSTLKGERDARLHFGETPAHDPACQIDVRAYRLMEENSRRHFAEDTELHRALQAKDAEMRTAVRQAEEQGYARGLEDAKKYPETLGLNVDDVLKREAA
jgi:hypothetical protein